MNNPYENLYDALLKEAGDHNLAQGVNTGLDALNLTLSGRLNRRALMGRKEMEDRRGRKSLFTSERERELMRQMPSSRDGKTYPISRFITHPMNNLANLATREIYARSVKNKVQDKNVSGFSKGERDMIQSILDKKKSKKK